MATKKELEQSNATATDGMKAVPPRQHRATYSKDKLKGGYLIRVEGPFANRFAGRSVPVVRKDGTETTETLSEVVWSGKDEESGKPVTLYSMEKKDKLDDEIPF